MLEKLREKYEIVVGLEVHAQLKTKSKLMSPAANAFGKEPNSNVSTVCTGMPGALPVINKQAIEMAVKTALSLNCDIQNKSIFSRKHYFYPDLPKGYQISQFDRPYAKNGTVEFYFQGKRQRIGLTRIHLEEDAGKNLHFGDQGVSLVDLNRSSVPLIEIVSEPDIRSPEEAGAYLKALRRVLRYLDVCDGNLEQGNFRCDANVSIKLKEAKEFGTRVELKNINSFRNLERAISFEALRQLEVLEAGKSVEQQTRLWDASANESKAMRSKEEASDYRYMPEPDLLPLVIKEESLQKFREELPELPMERLERFQKDYARSEYDAEVLSNARPLADYYEKVVAKMNDPQLASTFIQTNLLAVLNDIETDLENFYPDALSLADLLKRVKDKSLSLGMAKEVFEAMIKEKAPAEKIISERGLSQVNDDSALVNTVAEVLKNNPQQLSQYLSGRDKLFGFFMGQCQKLLKGKANPQRLKELLEQELKKKGE